MRQIKIHNIFFYQAFLILGCSNRLRIRTLYPLYWGKMVFWVWLNCIWCKGSGDIRGRVLPVPLPPDPLCPGVVYPVRIPFMGQIVLLCAKTLRKQRYKNENTKVERAWFPEPIWSDIPFKSVSQSFKFQYKNLFEDKSSPIIIINLVLLFIFIRVHSVPHRICHTKLFRKNL